MIALALLLASLSGTVEGPSPAGTLAAAAAPASTPRDPFLALTGASSTGATGLEGWRLVAVVATRKGPLATLAGGADGSALVVRVGDSVGPAQLESIDVAHGSVTFTVPALTLSGIAHEALRLEDAPAEPRRD